ncbi:hypothetical protein ABC733_13205 [Mangrovibacter sp. SLW1]
MNYVVGQEHVMLPVAVRQEVVQPARYCARVVLMSAGDGQKTDAGIRDYKPTAR